MTLLEILTGHLSYDQSLAVYAEKINGKFTTDSPARFGQTTFDNGETLDDCELFERNDQIVPLNEWAEGDPDFAEEAATQLIHNINEAIS